MIDSAAAMRRVWPVTQLSVTWHCNPPRSCWSCLAM